MAGRKRRPPAARAAATPVALAVPQVSAAQLGFEAAGSIAEGVGRLANTPVMGWERVTTYTKGRRNPKTVVEKASFEVRAWELALLGFAGIVILSAMNPNSGGTGLLGQAKPAYIPPGAEGWWQIVSFLGGGPG